MVGQRLDCSSESKWIGEQGALGRSPAAGARSARVSPQKAVSLLVIYHMAPNSKGPRERMLLFIYTVLILPGSHVVFLSSTQMVVRTATRINLLGHCDSCMDSLCPTKPYLSHQLL